MAHDDWYTRAEAAQVLGVTVGRISQLVQGDRLDVARDSERRIKVFRESVERYRSERSARTLSPAERARRDADRDAMRAKAKRGADRARAEHEERRLEAVKLATRQVVALERLADAAESALKIARAELD